MSSKFADGKPSAQAPSVCTATIPTLPLLPGLWPPALKATFYLTYSEPESPTILDIVRATLIKDPERLFWEADNRLGDVGYLIQLHYDEPDNELVVDYYRNIENFPETWQSWNDQDPLTLFPYYLALEKITDDVAWTTVWGYVKI